MKVIIIGNAGYGKSVLIDAFKQKILTVNIDNIEDNDKKSIEINEPLILEAEDMPLFDEILSNKNKHQKKGKEIKEWERTKFYQR